MYLFIHHRKYDSFFRSNKPRSVHYPHFDNFQKLYHTIFLMIWIPTSKMLKCFVGVRQYLGYASDWSSRSVLPVFLFKYASKHAYPQFQWFLCALAQIFLSNPDSYVKNAKIFCEHPSRPCLYSWLSLISSPTHFQSKSIHEACIRPILTILCAI